MKMKKFVAVLIGAVMCLSLAACNDGSNIEKKAGEKTSTKQTDSSDAAYSVGVAFQDVTNPLFASVSEYMTKKGKEKGWDVTVLDCQGNASTQISQVENFIEKSVDALVIYPADVEALTPICKRASEAGIKILSWDENMDSANMAYLVGNYEVGQAIGKETADWINEKYPDGCEVAVIDYATLPVIVERANGIVDAIKEHAPNAKIVAQDSALNAAEGMTLAENMLQAHPNIKAFACIGDGSGIGVNEALKAAGVNLDEYGVFACDATEEACAAISRGEAIRMSINLGTPEEMADKALECAETMLTSDDYEKEVYKTITPVNAENINEYYTK
ncbi:MAG: sugar ABC transporter substrate-binding protein [Ruminococcus sp.]|jgi:ribose transport system substrate-binding protein|nr:sugar ABC transporter substrate-binding protein [Ruminococcus sp.]